MKTILLQSALLGLILTLGGCATAAIGAITETGVTIAEKRSAGRKIDDLTIYTEINRLFLEGDSNDVLPNVTVNVRHGRVMLTGNVNEEKAVQTAIKLAWQVDDVTEVINEINVRPEATFFDNANDGLIKKNLEAHLLFTKGVRVIDYSIDVVSNVAYLLGQVQSEAELDNVLRVARTTKGIKKVVSHLKVNVGKSNVAPQQSYGENPSINTDTESPNTVEILPFPEDSISREENAAPQNTRTEF